MSTRVEIEPRVQHLEPGGVATCTVRVRNLGTEAQVYTLQVAGAAAAWAEMTPATLAVPAEDAGTVTLRFRPPRHHSVAAGRTHFAVRATPGVHRGASPWSGSVAGEGTLEVAAFQDIAADLEPRIATGRGPVRHTLVLTNRGNTSASLRLVPHAAEDGPRPRPEQESVDLPPGETRRLPVRVDPPSRRLGGRDVEHPYGIGVQHVEDPQKMGESRLPPATAEATAEVVAEGGMLQQGLLRGWLAAGLIGLVVLPVAGAVAHAEAPGPRSTAITPAAAPGGDPAARPTPWAQPTPYGPPTPWDQPTPYPQPTAWPQPTPWDQPTPWPQPTPYPPSSPGTSVTNVTVNATKVIHSTLSVSVTPSPSPSPSPTPTSTPAPGRTPQGNAFGRTGSTPRTVAHTMIAQ